MSSFVSIAKASALVALIFSIANCALGGENKQLPKNHEQPRITDYEIKGRYVFDKKRHLTWDRCSFGMQWQHGNCSGEPKLVTYQAAAHAARDQGSGWRVPSVEELFNLAAAFHGQAKKRTLFFPGFIDLGENESSYWSSSVFKEFPGYYGYVDMMNGSVDIHSAGFSLGVVFVKLSGE